MTEDDPIVEAIKIRTLLGGIDRTLENLSIESTVHHACDHPDASSVDINIMFEFTPAGERIRRPGIRTASRH